MDGLSSELILLSVLYCVLQTILPSVSNLNITMSYYKCHRCDYISKQKIDMKRHLDKKMKCIIYISIITVFNF